MNWLDKVELKRIYVDGQVRLNLRGIDVDRRKKGYTRDVLSLLVNRVKSDCTAKYVSGKCLPSLGVYIRLGEVLGWNFEGDPNHIFYYRLISSAELYRRLKRVGLLVGDVARWCNVDAHRVSYCLKYRAEGSPVLFGEILKYLAMEERIMGVYWGWKGKDSPIEM